MWKWQTLRLIMGRSHNIGGRYGSAYKFKRRRIFVRWCFRTEVGMEKVEEVG